MTRIARLPPEQRREQLLACAVKVFAEHGLGAGNHGLVATEAHVSVPTVFFYFNTRDSLVDAVLSEVESRYKGVFAKSNQDDRPAGETLLNLSRMMTHTADTHPYHSRVFLEWSVAVRAEIWPRYLKLHRYIIKALTRLIKRGQREGSCRPELIPEDEAQILHASSYALAQMKLTGASASRIERFQQSMVNTMLIHPVSVDLQKKGPATNTAPSGRPRRKAPLTG